MENYPKLEKRNLHIKNDNFEKHCNWANKIVQNIQFNSNEKNIIPLSFYPIAKNIRFPSSYMVKNILQNKSSIIDNYCRHSELIHWENVLKRGNWYPWLWARGRINGNYKNIDGWKYYFNSFTEKHAKIYNNEEPIKEPTVELKTFFIYLACIKYTFDLNEKYMKIMDNYKKEMKWPTNKNILAVQIRRGETCTADCTKGDREVIKLEKYIEEIEILLKNNDFEYIYISTDSNEEIKNLQKIKPDWKLIFLPIDRSKFFRMDNNATPTKNGFSGIAQDLEDSCRLYPEKIPFIVDSGLADLYFISICHGYISTLTNSEFSKCGWYLQLANQGKMLPYININEEDINMNKRDMLLLL